MTDKTNKKNLDVNEYKDFAKLTVYLNEKRYGEAVHYSDEEY